MKQNIDALRMIFYHYATLDEVWRPRRIDLNKS